MSAQVTERRRAGWLPWTIGLIITALYGYAVVAAAGNLVGMPQAAVALGLTVTATGWAWLSLGVALPIVVFAVALLVARGRSSWVRILLLITGLCVVAVLQLDLMHLVPPSRYFG